MKYGSYKVFRKEFAASFRFLPLVIGGMVTPLFIYIVFGLDIGKNISLGHGIPFKQYIVSGTILFQLVYSTFYQSSYNTFFSSTVTQTMDELLTSPLSSKDILIGRVATTSAIGVIVCMPLLIILTIISGIKCPVWMMLLIIIYLILIAVIFSLLGTLLGLLVLNEFSLINFANAIVIPVVFLSDTFKQITDNKIINYILYLSPVKLGNVGMRSLLLWNKLDLLTLILLIIYTIIAYFIVYKIFEIKSRE